MIDFTIHFFICNFLLSILIGGLLLAKSFLQKLLTSRMQYNLWLVLLGLFAAPFFSLPSLGSPLGFLKEKSLGLLQGSESAVGAGMAKSLAKPGSDHWMHDFTMAVSKNAPSSLGRLLFAVWAIGMAAMALRMAGAAVQLRRLKASALPLQSPEVRRLYAQCLREMGIRRAIPIYSAAYLKSPIITGLFLPRIYLPIHLIADCPPASMRHMLLHELAHYKYKDALVNYFMGLAAILYWFNPLVWLALRQIQDSQEIACDTSALHLLKESDYEAYGYTLINLAEKISFSPFPFSSGIGGTMGQIRQRILNIASYRPLSWKRKAGSALAFLLAAIFLLSFFPVLSTKADRQDKAAFPEEGKQISYLDLSMEFGESDGSFALYDEKKDLWLIYNKEAATTRIAPSSTYKPYTALFGLESGIITPHQSQIPWDGQDYSYEAWNQGHSLSTAMELSVTWYFQSIDRQLGQQAIEGYLHRIGYGNQTAKGDLSSYWVDSTLKISPVEQVELLKKLDSNEFGFSPENIQAVKNSIHLYSTEQGSLYGKTGTDAQSTSGWFVGYVEKDGQSCYFATNIQKEENATGAVAAETAFAILSKLGIFQRP